MKTGTITVKLSIAWWLMPYLKMVFALADLTGMEPHQERVGYWINKGIKVDGVE